MIWVLTSGLHIHTAMDPVSTSFKSPVHFRRFDCWRRSNVHLNSFVGPSCDGVLSSLQNPYLTTSSTMKSWRLLIFMAFGCFVFNLCVVHCALGRRPLLLKAKRRHLLQKAASHHFSFVMCH